MNDTPSAAAPDEPHWARVQVPSEWVSRFLAGVPADGTVLDVACGTGRHVRLALERGYRVTAIDRDLSRLGETATHPRLETIVADLETGAAFPVADRRFDAVVVTNYLWRPILPAIAGAVAEDGLLIYETFGPGQERHGRPSQTDFHLRANELARLAIAAGLVIVAFEQGELDGRFCSGGAMKIVQRIAAVGPRHRWALEAPRPLGGE